MNAHPNRWQRRLGVVRGFARYLSTIDPQTEISSEDLLRASLPRVALYLYSQTEITALMGAARELTPPLRAATFETIIGLLAVSGLRVGEALGLDRADVDLHDGAIHVRAGKQAKQREVPLHETTTRALVEHGRLRDRFMTEPQSPAFFLSPAGTRVQKSAFNATFANLIRQIGLEGCGQRVRPRPHDLRHSFCCPHADQLVPRRRGRRPADAAALHVPRACRSSLVVLVLAGSSGTVGADQRAA